MFSKRIMVGLVCTSLSFPFISACSVTDDLLEGFSSIASGEDVQVSVEERMNDTQETNQGYEFSDNEQTRQEISHVVEDFYIDLTSYDASDEELLEIDKDLTASYASDKAEEFLGGEPISGAIESTDVEYYLSSYPDTEIRAAVNSINRYSPPEWLTNYESLLPVHKLMAATYIGDLKSFYTYNMRLNEDDTLSEFEVDETQLIFREGDVIVPQSAVTTNISEESTITELPLRIILENGSWKVDVFNAATIYHSPLMLQLHLGNDLQTPEETVRLVDDGLHKNWNR